MTPKEEKDLKYGQIYIVEWHYRQYNKQFAIRSKRKLPKIKHKKKNIKWKTNHHNFAYDLVLFKQKYEKEIYAKLLYSSIKTDEVGIDLFYPIHIIRRIL